MIIFFSVTNNISARNGLVRVVELKKYVKNVVMPKKQKKKDETTDSHEGRPKNLTLADFLVVKKNKSVANVSNVNSESSTLQCHDTAAAAFTGFSETNSLLSDAMESASTNQCASNEIVNVDGPTKTGEDLQHFFVCRTKKGGVPVKVESRASGKKVTVIEHVLGDGKALLSELKSKFGTGGQFKEGAIELQGDLLSKVTKYLNANKQILKPYGTTL